MSAEQITNQAHLHKQKESHSSRFNINNLNKELQINQNQQKTPAIEPNNLLHTNNIQRLLSQQSELAKQNITKKSLETMQDKGQIHNAELEDEVNKELEKYFHPKQNTTDSPTVSKEYKESIQAEHEKKPEADQQVGAQVGAKKSKQKKELTRTKKNILEQLNEPSDEDPTDIIKLRSSKEPLEKKARKEKTARQVEINQKDLKEFAKMISKYAVTQDPNVKQTIEKQKKALLHKGISPNEINHMANKVGQVVKQHMVYDLKQKLIHFHMSKGFSKQERIQSSLQFNSSSKALDNLSQTGRLPINLSDSVTQLKHQAKQDLGNFLYEESVNQFTKQSLGQLSLKEFTEELVKLQKAAQSAGVEISEKDLTEKIYSAIDHLGLAEFTRPNADSDNNQKEPERIITQEEALDDKLRYLYMMKALHPSLRHKIDTHFKMKKCRNGMIKLGFYTEEKESALKKQGEFLAAAQFKEELQFIFREEATLPHLSGSEYGVIRKKKAFFLSQLRKIEHGLTTDEIQQIKESMYREMYGLMKEELLQLKEMVEIHPHVSITRKLKHLKEVIKRIKEDIQVHDFQDNIKSLISPTRTSQINEGA